jgi:Secretion system C-terminal sorting domain
MTINSTLYALRSTLTLRKSIAFLIFWACFSLSLNAQYSPNFSVANKGIPVYTGAVDNAFVCMGVNNGSDPSACTYYDVSGMNWTLTGTVADPFEWRYANATLMADRPFANTFAGNKFQTRRTFGDICMTSPVINIAGLGTVTINFRVDRIGAGTYLSAGDDVEFKYILNGGSPVSSGTLGSTTGSLGAGTNSSWTQNVTGNTLQIFACMAQNSANEDYELTTFSANKGVVLPIELSGFFAKVNTHNQVVLDWQTATEQSNAYFDIERSADGQSYKSIGQVKSLGNTANGYTYQYVDTEPLEAIAYYRLKQVDNDGTFKYSPTVSVDRNKAKFNARIFSNPVAHELEIGLTKTQNATVSFIITDLLGKVVAQETRLQGNDTLLTMNVNHLKAGIYLLKVAVNGIQETHKFVKI